MLSTTSNPTPVPASTRRLAAVRQQMAQHSVDAVLVRSTDRFLNEYVPNDESTRVWLTGFTGSMGDALVTADQALLFVDGRYGLQAGAEAPAFEARVVPLGTSIEAGWLGALSSLHAAGVRRLGVETDRVPLSLMRSLERQAQTLGMALVPTVPSLVEAARREAGEDPPKTPRRFWPIDPGLSGRTVVERLALGASLFADKKLDAQLVLPLDEIAWITNLRGLDLPYQATFKGRALVVKTDDGFEIVVACDPTALAPGPGPTKRSAPVPQVEPGVRLVNEGALPSVLQALSGRLGRAPRVGFDAAHCTAHAKAMLDDAGCTAVDVESAYAWHRTQKTPSELLHMQRAFARADDVVSKVQRWLNQSLQRGERVSEADVAEKTRALFHKSGAFGLSFKVISAAGKNGAVIHYSTPDAERMVQEGELFLLDTGAYYEGGLATDLTRTFLAGGPQVKATEEQQRLFTLVLKAAIAGMTARIPVGATGEQLDALVRQPMWQAGLDYGHGTGHGVGVNVHEAPPRIAIGARTVLEVGQVFSIEPGVYLPAFGGVRIENLCTLVPDPSPPTPGITRQFLRVKPLTFSPLDRRLIDKRLLSAHEKRFLAWFHKSVPAGEDRGLPPLDDGAVPVEGGAIV